MFFLPNNYIAPDGSDWLIFLFAGVASVFTWIGYINAYKRYSPVSLAPFEYLALIGAAIAVCQESAACSAFLNIITLLFIIIGIIGWLCSGCECNCERPSNKQIRRGFRMGGAYGATRLWRNH